MASKKEWNQMMKEKADEELQQKMKRDREKYPLTEEDRKKFEEIEKRNKEDWDLTLEEDKPHFKYLDIDYFEKRRREKREKEVPYQKEEAWSRHWIYQEGKRPEPINPHPHFVEGNTLKVTTMTPVQQILWEKDKQEREKQQPLNSFNLTGFITTQPLPQAQFGYWPLPREVEMKEPHDPQTTKGECQICGFIHPQDEDPNDVD